MTQSTLRRPLMARVAGRMTQLCGAGAILIGTVAFALLLDQLDGIYVAILAAWVGAGMSAMICGGWAVRPSPTSLVISAALDAAFAGVLLAVATRLPVWLRLMTPADAEAASTVVVSLAVTSGLTMLVCLISTPAALRYWRTPSAAPEGLGVVPSNTSPGFPPPVVTGAFLAAGDSGELVAVGGVPVAARAQPTSPAKAYAQAARPSGGSTAPGLAFAPAVARPAHQPMEISALPVGGVGVGLPPTFGQPVPPAPLAFAQPQSFAPPQALGQPMPPAWGTPAAAWGPPSPSPSSGQAMGSPWGTPPGAPAYAPPPFGAPAYAPPPSAYSTAMAYDPRSPRPPTAGSAPLPLPLAPGGPPYAQPDPMFASPSHVAPAQPSAPKSRRGLVIIAAGITVGVVCAVILAVVQGGGSSTTSGASSTGSARSAAPTAPTATPVAALAPPTSPAPAAPQAPANVEALLDAVHAAAARSDEAALRELLVPDAFAFGVKATGIHRDADAVARAFREDLGPAPEGGFSITPIKTTIGAEGDAAWIAEELEVVAGAQRKTFAVSMLAAAVGGGWKIVAWHWAVRMTDEEVERLSEEGDLPIPEGFDDRLAAPAEAVESFRAAFTSPEAFSLAVSGRPTAFNFGSAPRERLVGGEVIQRVFRKLRAETSLGEGVMVVSTDAWDPSKKAAPDVAWAAANVEFTTSKTRRLLRVLTVLVKEGGEWRIVQAQWSDGR